ncbi:MAG: class I SAM-dependent methyltransferase [Anaerolineales bacterium]|nr:MAG: class I SAM-dependent methyltransferase [Anaerolineales bacterium]
MPTALAGRLAAALENRTDLLARLHAEDTDCYRLFHGTAEGQPGLTIDRYGDLLLVQTFHQALTPDELTTIEAFYAREFPALTPVYNDRSQKNSRIRNPLPAERQQVAAQAHTVRELGVRYRVQARHDGQDAWLFLDMRAGRRHIMQGAAGKSLLNLFAYTCSVGTAAAVAGASQVVNIDFAAGTLAVGQQNAELNSLSIQPQFIKSDVFPAVRQLAGIGQAQFVRGKRMPAFPKLAAQQFDMVFLDPPRYAKSPFGVVDLVNDYPAVFKPALLCTAEGGTLYCCNNVAAVERDGWLAQLQRSAAKAGRPIRSHEWIMPEADFPSPDNKPPLKVLALGV